MSIHVSCCNEPTATVCGIGEPTDNGAACRWCVALAFSDPECGTCPHRPASPVPEPGEGDAATTSGEQEAGPRP